MSSSKNSDVGKMLKALIITAFKLLAVIAAFVCKIIALVLSKLSELLEKISGYGTGY